MGCKHSCIRDFALDLLTPLFTALCLQSLLDHELIHTDAPTLQAGLPQPLPGLALCHRHLCPKRRRDLHWRPRTHSGGPAVLPVRPLVGLRLHRHIHVSIFCLDCLSAARPAALAHRQGVVGSESQYILCKVYTSSRSVCIVYVIRV